MAETAFREGHVDADGFRIRYLEAGDGVPLVHLHGAGGLRLTPAHELLARRFRVVAFEMPGFGNSPVNTRTESMPALASTMARAGDGSDLQRPDAQLPPGLRVRRGARDQHRSAGGVHRSRDRLSGAPRGVRHQPRRDGDPPLERRLRARRQPAPSVSLHALDRPRQELGAAIARTAYNRPGNAATPHTRA